MVSELMINVNLCKRYTSQWLWPILFFLLTSINYVCIHNRVKKVTEGYYVWNGASYKWFVIFNRWIVS